MPDDLIIRDAHIKDSKNVLPIWDEFIAYHKQITTMDFEMADGAREMWRRYFETHVRSRNRKAIVAEQDGEIVGFLLGEIQKRPPVFITPYQGYVDSIGVLESRRYQGIGTLMLDAFGTWAREKGMPHIMLLVVVENAPAIKCYERCGYTTTILMQKKSL
jgi:ribosomal protein S18 acetylase RimI-like enzyme